MTCCQFLLLLWKSLKTSIRSPLWTIFELLLPLFGVFVFYYFGVIANTTFAFGRKTPFDKVKDYRSNHETGKKNDYIQSMGAIPGFIPVRNNIYSVQLLYSCTDYYCDEAEEFGSAINKFYPNFNVTPIKDVDEHLDNVNESAIILKLAWDKGGSLRLVSQSPPPILTRKTFDESSDEYGTPEDRFGSFWGWEHTILLQFLTRYAAKGSKPLDDSLSSISSRQVMDLPDGFYPKDSQYISLGHPLLALVFIPILGAISIAREISQDNESGMKEYLVVMGMSRLLNFIHHYVFAVIKVLPAMILLQYLIAHQLTLLGLHFDILILFFILNCLAVGMVAGAIFSKPNNAFLMAIGLIVGEVILAEFYEVLRTRGVVGYLAILVPAYSTRMGMDVVTEAMIRGIPVPWFNDIAYIINYGQCLICLVLSTILLILFSVYIDWAKSAHASIIGLIKRKLFGLKKTEQEVAPLNSTDKNDELNDSEEIDVELTEVHKIYASGEHAVKGIDLKLFRGQVTALLGHNGAGKSTTFSMISGMTMPSSGTVRIGDQTTKENRKECQKSIGFCPQYNPLFPTLTVDDHLNFFARLRGVPMEVWKMEREDLLEVLLLKDKRNTKSKNLSGGMKRKLCVAMAMIGHNHIILLDEPTAGMDTGARRDIEKLLTKYKHDKTFLLTTHYTDEAEQLGDRIIILAGGRIVCSGSPQFLNKRFGAGYMLSCSSQHDSNQDDFADAVIQIVQKHIPSARLHRKHGQQIEIWLSKDNIAFFSPTFKDLEEQGPAIGMDSFGLSLNSLEQVFLKVGELTGSHGKEEQVNKEMAELLNANRDRFAPNDYSKWIFQFLTHIYKRFFYESTRVLSLLFLILLVVLSVYCTTVIRNALLDMFKPNGDQDAFGLDRHLRVLVDNEVKKECGGTFSHLYPSIILVETSDIQKLYTDTILTERPVILGGVRKDSTTKNFEVFYSPFAEDKAFVLDNVLEQCKGKTKMKLSVIIQQMSQEQMKAMEAIMKDKNMLKGIVDVITLFMCFITLPIIVSRSVNFYVAERSSKFAHQQRLTGMALPVYWIANFIWDTLIFTFFVVIMILCMVFWNISTGAIPQVIMYAYFFFLICELKIFILHRLFISKSKATMLHILLFLLPPIAIIIVFIVAKGQQTNDGLYSFEISDFGMPIDPLFANINHLYGTNTVKYLVSIAFQILVLFIIFVLVENRIVRFACNRMMGFRTKGKEIENEEEIDSKVERERKEIEEGKKEDLVEVHSLTKWYNKRMCAVRGISFGVQEHECFGFLGVNGAGKTSTFEMLTGSTFPSSGTAVVAGVNCSEIAHIGYCPQFDALIGELTGKQSVRILAALHGYRHPRKVADIVIACVGMTEHADKKTKNYSGGQRRKISVAASLLAQNSLIILDEPTAGIDPVARRDIWSVLCALRDSSDTAIILTTHSMDECEALCSRVAIVRRGRLAALGTTQELKTKYGNHYKLFLDVDKEERQVSYEVFRTFPKAILNSIPQPGRYRYEIPREVGEDQPWSVLFESAQKLAIQLHADDFSLSQANLEDAFILFAADRPDNGDAVTSQTQANLTPDSPPKEDVKDTTKTPNDVESTSNK